jgi:CPA2 family monovalent cation:H+ antiporter-2
LGDLAFDEVGAEVTAVRRGNQRIEPDEDTELRAGDVVVLRGTGMAVSRAEGRLLR